MTTNSYHKAILLLQEEQDWKSICFHVAANYPDVFCEAHYYANHPNELELNNRIIDVLNCDRRNKIKAVKMYREITGSELNDAMDYVTRLIESLNL